MKLLPSVVFTYHITLKRGNDDNNAEEIPPLAFAAGDDKSGGAE